MKRRAALQKERPSKKQRVSANSLAVTQAIVRNELRKNTDWLYTDISVTTTNVSSSGTITSLYGNLTRGDLGLDNFNGNIVKPQALRFKYFWSSSAFPYNACRVLIFQWFDAATPTLSGILQTNATSIATVAPILVTNKQYIKVLYDKTVVVAPVSGDGSGGVLGAGHEGAFDVYIPGKRLQQTKFNSGSNTVQDGNIYVLTLTDDSIGTYPQVTWYSRITFADQ